MGQSINNNFLRVVGRRELKGTVKISGNKNAALPAIAATLLTDETVILENLPNIIDVQVMLEIAEALGVDVNYDKKRNCAELTAKNIKTSDISRHLCAKIRTSVLFTAPLVVRCQKVTLWPPGGDIIGRRRLDGHFYGLQGLGVEVLCETLPYQFKAPKRLHGKELFLDEASVTATEQIMLAAVLADGVTILRNAASEPHVIDLGVLLNKMGARINGLGTNTLTIEGVKKLHGTSHEIVSDHIETGSFIALGSALNSELTIENITPGHYWMMHRVFERLGVHFSIDKNKIFLPSNQELKVQKDFGNAIPTIADGPWPQFPSDMMSCTIVTATQAEGTVLFFEKMFESRLYFVDRLISMGANAISCDPHRVVISGVSQLRGVEMSSPDIRAGMALLIAAMTAYGESTIRQVSMIQRGYENLIEKLQKIGAAIELKSE
ncbi:UDP-N-acetylglucosamine 1-carboxyvinyltransferase [Lentisphaerota bacterium WC36G]|nr:UDP-N-acetylglucosamine 1-carboxyvinyltransferase [Lentisphaerae bacterium WC36]